MPYFLCNLHASFPTSFLYSFLLWKMDLHYLFYRYSSVKKKRLFFLCLVILLLTMYDIFFGIKCRSIVKNWKSRIFQCVIFFFWERVKELNQLNFQKLRKTQLYVFLFQIVWFLQTRKIVYLILNR